MCLVKIKLSPSHLLSNALIFLEKEILFWPHQQFCTQSFIHYYKVQSSSGKKSSQKAAGANKGSKSSSKRLFIFFLIFRNRDFSGKIRSNSLFN
jgi:hypothetical protein